MPKIEPISNWDNLRDMKVGEKVNHHPRHTVEELTTYYTCPSRIKRFFMNISFLLKGKEMLSSNVKPMFNRLNMDQLAKIEDVLKQAKVNRQDEVASDALAVNTHVTQSSADKKLANFARLFFANTQAPSHAKKSLLTENTPQGTTTRIADEIKKEALHPILQNELKSGQSLVDRWEDQIKELQFQLNDWQKHKLKALEAREKINQNAPDGISWGPITNTENMPITREVISQKKSEIEDEIRRLRTYITDQTNKANALRGLIEQLKNPETTFDEINHKKKSGEGFIQELVRRIVDQFGSFENFLVEMQRSIPALPTPIKLNLEHTLGEAVFDRNLANESERLDVYSSANPRTQQPFLVRNTNVNLRIHDAILLDSSYAIREKTDNQGHLVKDAQGQPLMVRDRDPIADDMILKRYYNQRLEGEVILFSGTDGSDAGNNVTATAMTANASFMRYAEKALSQGVENLRDLGRISLEGMMQAKKDIEPLEKNTTFTGMIAFKTQEPIKDSPKDFKTVTRGVITIIGDSKVYLRKKDGSVIDLTAGNRGSSDAQDPGGRIGGPGIDPRNLRLITFEAEKGDVLLPMSDGIEDNLVDDSGQIESKEKLLEALLKDQSVENFATTLGKFAKDRTAAKREVHSKQLNEPDDMLGKIDHISVAQITL